MRFYTKQHKFYCGIDLHAKKMYLCILDQAGEIRLHRNIKTDRGLFLNLIKPFRDDIVIAVECMFTWYWIANLCKDHGIPFVLGHALYMKAIHGGKAKNDKIDSHKIAVLLRGGMIPMAYTYPENMRATRDLLRRRNHLMRKRAELYAHIQNTRSQVSVKQTHLARGSRKRYDAALRLKQPPVTGSLKTQGCFIGKAGDACYG